MIKSNKTYRIASICNFILHICVAVFVTVVGFLPFREGQNFYECIASFFGIGFMPYLLMGILVLCCVFAFLAIKNPLFSFLVLACSLAFFVNMIFPYSFEASLMSFASPWISGITSSYKIGFKMLIAVSYIVYYDVAFCVYSVFALLIRAKKR